MLDGLLGRGFVSKCKSLIKPTKTRLEALRKRAEAKQRFLKEDLAKLLANGLDINAYGRTEEFLAGLCLLSHYDFIEYTCDFLLKNLSIMQKQRECPENCREAVGSLMFAAARFSDLPELRDLRDAFQERYGNSIEHFVNQVFVDKLASRPPTLEKRLQLLRDIALEFSIKWDSHGFEQRMGTPSAFLQDQNKKYGPPKVTSDISKYSNGNGTNSKSDKRDVISKERSHSVSDGQTMRNSKGGNVSTREDTDIKLVKRQEYNENRNRPLLMTIAKKEEQDTLFRGKSEVSVNLSELLGGVDGRSNSSASNEHDSRLNISMSKRKVGEEEADRLKSYHNTPRPPPYMKLKDNAIPAPYVKPKVNNGEAVISLHDKGNAVANLHMKQKEDHRHHEEGFGPTRVNGHRHEKEPTYQNDIPLPKPRSTRRKQSKSSSTHYDDEKIEDTGIVKKSSSSRRKEHSRKGLQLLFDDEHHQKDEEERMMDKLLLHYSKKPSDFDVGKLRKNSHAYASNHKDSSGSKLRHASSRDGPDVSPEMVLPPTRSVSLPREQTALPEPTKVYARANSFQPDNMARHVHPKLPDYDDLAAQFAAMRGR